jgi:hypothetical protein
LGDDADRAFRVAGAGNAVAAWLAFIRDQHLAAVRREHQHVGQRADLHAVDQLEVGGVVERHGARIGLDRRFDGKGDQAVVHGDAVDGLAEARDADRAQQLGCSRCAQVQHIDRAIGAVDDEQALAGRIVGSDLGRADGAAVVAADFFQRQRGGCRFVVMVAAAGSKRARQRNRGNHRKVAGSSRGSRGALQHDGRFSREEKPPA